MPKIATDVTDSRSLYSTGGAQAAASRAEVAKVNSLKSQGKDSPEQVKKATQGFEALLLQQMMQSMFETVDRGDLLGESSNEADIMRGMFTQAVADEISKGTGIGVKDVVMKEVQKRQKAEGPETV